MGLATQNVGDAMSDVVNACSDCRSSARNEVGICGRRRGSDGLPVLCVGPWALDKHYFLDRFCSIFATGMKNKWKERYYIDLFSGPGLCINNEDGKEISGSPLIAVSQPFTHFIFVESHAASLDALKRRIKNVSNSKHVDFIPGDVNEVIDELLGRLVSHEALFFTFADPFNIQLKMVSLEQLANQRRLDMLIHFPYGTYLRRVLSQSKLSETTERQIDSFFGAARWRDLCDQSLNAASFLNYYEKQLESFGYKVGDNFPNMKNRRKAGLYYLVFASKDQRGLDFWEKACAIEPSGQRKLPGF